MYYIKYLDMFRAILCSSSGGQNYIITASGIVTLCERPCSAPVESGLLLCITLNTSTLFEQYFAYLQEVRGRAKCMNLIRELYNKIVFLIPHPPHPPKKKNCRCFLLNLNPGQVRECKMPEVKCRCASIRCNLQADGDSATVTVRSTRRSVPAHGHEGR
jgi:hypothetical protein